MHLTLRLRPVESWLRADLAGALDRGEVAVHYQPVVSLADERVTGAEALVRWTHPALGPVSPAEFVGAAERDGTIHALGTWALRTATATAAGWRGAPYVAVNVSAVELDRPNFADVVLQTLADTGLPADRLALEITETATLVDSERAARRLELLRAAGVRVVIDDFGTGYSLVRLCTLPADALKIDRLFVERVVRDPVSRAVVASVIALAHRIGLDAIAEGVEDRDQCEVLRDLACDGAQGYLWSQAVPADVLDRLL